jgi:hypothetical protein
MALRHKLTKDEHTALPEALRDHYKEADGAFVLDGFAPVDTLNEFRTNNRQLKGELAALREKYGDLDPEKARAAMTELEKNKAAAPDVQKMIDDAVARATTPLTTRLGAMELERNTLREKNQRQTFETTINEAATKAGVQPDYLIDVRSRAAAYGFRVQGDTVRALGGDKGEDPILDKDGKEVTLPDFLKQLPGAFYGRTGGAGAGRDRQPGGTPMAKGTLYNPSPVEFGRHAEAIAKGDVTVINP